MSSGANLLQSGQQTAQAASTGLQQAGQQATNNAQFGQTALQNAANAASQHSQQNIASAAATNPWQQGLQSSVQNGFNQFQQATSAFQQNPGNTAANAAMNHFQQGQQTVGQHVATQMGQNQLQQAANRVGQFSNSNAQNSATGALNQAASPWNQYPSAHQAANGVHQHAQNAATSVQQQAANSFGRYPNVQNAANGAQNQFTSAAASWNQSPSSQKVTSLQQASNSFSQVPGVGQNAVSGFNAQVQNGAHRFNSGVQNGANHLNSQLQNAANGFNSQMQNGANRFNPNVQNGANRVSSGVQNAGNRFNPQVQNPATGVLQGTNTFGQNLATRQNAANSQNPHQYSTAQSTWGGQTTISGPAGPNSRQQFYNNNGRNMLDQNSQNLVNKRFLDSFDRHVLPNFQQNQNSGGANNQRNHHHGIQNTANWANQQQNQARGSRQQTQSTQRPFIQQRGFPSLLSNGRTNIGNTVSNAATRAQAVGQQSTMANPLPSLNPLGAIGSNTVPGNNLFSSLTQGLSGGNAANQVQTNPLSNIFQGLKNVGQQGPSANSNPFGAIGGNNGGASAAGLFGSLSSFQGVSQGLIPQSGASGNRNLLGGLDVLGSSPLNGILGGVNAQSVGSGALAGLGIQVDGDQCDVAACDGSFEQMEGDFRRNVIGGQFLGFIGPIFSQFRNCKEKADKNYFQQMQSQFDIKTLMSNGFNVANINTALQKTCLQGLKSEERKCKNLQCIMCKFIAPKCGQVRGKRQTKPFPERVQKIFGNLPIPQSGNPSWDNYRTKYARLPNQPGGPNDSRYKQGCVNEKVDFAELLKLFREIGSTGEAERTCQGLSSTIQNPSSLGSFVQGRTNAGILGGSLGGISSIFSGR